MPTSKFAVSMDPKLLTRLDRLVKGRRFRSRSEAVQIAVREKLERIERSRLARECRKLNSAAEQAMAEEGMSGELGTWPEY